MKKRVLVVKREVPNFDDCDKSNDVDGDDSQDDVKIDASADRQLLPGFCSNRGFKIGGKTIILPKLLADQAWILQRIPKENGITKIPTDRPGFNDIKLFFSLQKIRVFLPWFV